MEYTHRHASPLGGITIASDGAAVTGLWFDGQKHFADTLDETSQERALPVFALTDHWLCLYFQGAEPDFTPPLRLKGSPFRKMVWEILLTIPYGQTRSYGSIAAELAKQLGRQSMSAQAIGGAVAHNPISLIVPCHRVLGATGNLTGYAGGIDKKIRLLQLEGHDPSGFPSQRRAM